MEAQLLEFALDEKGLDQRSQRGAVDAQAQTTHASETIDSCVWCANPRCCPDDGEEGAREGVLPLSRLGWQLAAKGEGAPVVPSALQRNAPSSSDLDRITAAYQ